MIKFIIELIKWFAELLVHYMFPPKPTLEIEYESKDYLVVNKIYDLILYDLHASHQVTVETILEKLRPDIGIPKRPGSFYFAHRLDFATSGLLCIPKNARACSIAGKAFKQRKVLKYYLAIVRGHISVDSLDIRYQIQDDDASKYRAKDTSYPILATQTARTTVVVLEKGFCCNYPATKVLIQIHTGRRHQIRVHMVMIGHRVVGDYTYSKRYDSDTYRMYLHSYKMKCSTIGFNINVTTKDPFTPNDAENEWIPCERICGIDNALRKIKEESSLIMS